MVMPGLPRLDGPFAATRRYGGNVLPVAFDILTLPFQISNTLTGLPPIEIPNFGGVAPAGGVLPGPTLAPMATPMPKLFDTYLSQILTSYDIAQLDYAREMLQGEFRAGNLSYLDYLTLTNTYNLRRAALSPVLPMPTPGGAPFQIGNEPGTPEEAYALISALTDATAAAPEPGPATVLSYSITDIFPLGSLLPPPQLDGKPHRVMELDVLPEEFLRIDAYVIGRRIEGDFQIMLRNKSSEIDIPSGEVTTFLDTIEENAQARLIDGVSNTSQPIPKGEIAKKVIPFIFNGTWALIKAIWEYLVHKRITVRLDMPVRIPGFETPDFVVGQLNKRFVSEVRIPANNIHWHAW